MHLLIHWSCQSLPLHGLQMGHWCMCRTCMLTTPVLLIYHFCGTERTEKPESAESMVISIMMDIRTELCWAEIELHQGGFIALLCITLSGGNSFMAILTLPRSQWLSKTGKQNHLSTLKILAALQHPSCWFFFFLLAAIVSISGGSYHYSKGFF